MTRDVPMPSLMQPGQAVWACINRHGRILRVAMTSEDAAKGSEFYIHRKLRKLVRVLVVGVKE